MQVPLMLFEDIKLETQERQQFVNTQRILLGGRFKFKDSLPRYRHL